MAEQEEGKVRVDEPASGCRVFVSYRREDSADATDRLADALVTHFGSDRIFLDIDNIDLGADFAQTIEDWVGSCDALVVVIGPRWATATDRAGRRRLDDPHDYVRLEVEAGLRRRDVRVIPVMIHGAEIPLAEELPESLQPLRRRNALQIDRKNWRYDIARLCKTLERIEPRPDHGSSTPLPTSSAAVPGEVATGVASSSTAVRCLKCGTMNDAGATYCRRCGFSLFDDALDADRLIEPPSARHLEVVLEPTVVKLLPGEQAQMFARALDDRPDADLRWELAGAAAELATSSKTTTGVQIALHPGTDEPPARMPLDVQCFERDELVGEAHGTVEVLQVELAAPTLEKDTSHAETETGEPTSREPTEMSDTVTVRTISAHGSVRLVGPTAVHVGGAVAITGAIAVIASLPGGGPQQDNVGYWLPVAVMSAGVIVLIGYALRSNRRAPLIGGTALALALLGVTFPLSWHFGGPHPFQFPGTPNFWLGACGAALAALGAALASWQMYAEPSGRPSEPTPTWSRATRFFLTIPGPLIVIASLLFLDEWTPPNSAHHPVWQNWRDVTLRRYPSAMILLCAFVVALAVAGIRSNRPRLLVIAAGVACLVLGESVPLIFTDLGNWGPGRYLAIAGAVLAVAGLALAAARSGDAVPQRPGWDQPRP
jgi:hypothetical protein